MISRSPHRSQLRCSQLRLLWGLPVFLSLSCNWRNSKAAVGGRYDMVAVIPVSASLWIFANFFWSYLYAIALGLHSIAYALLLPYNMWDLVFVHFSGTRIQSFCTISERMYGLCKTIKCLIIVNFCETYLMNVPLGPPLKIPCNL